MVQSELGKALYRACLHARKVVAQLCPTLAFLPHQSLRPQKATTPSQDQAQSQGQLLLEHLADTVYQQAPPQSATCRSEQCCAQTAPVSKLYRPIDQNAEPRFSTIQRTRATPCQVRGRPQHCAAVRCCCMCVAHGGAAAWARTFSSLTGPLTPPPTNLQLQP